MSSVINTIIACSAMKIGESLEQFTFRKNLSLNLLPSNEACDVAKRSLNILVGLNAKIAFLKNKLKFSIGQLNCYIWNDYSGYVAIRNQKTNGMLHLLSPVRALEAISSSFSFNLIERLAYVHLHENRLFIIYTKGLLFKLIHLGNIKRRVNAIAVIVPTILELYSNPEIIEDIVDFILLRLFDKLDEVFNYKIGLKGGQ